MSTELSSDWFADHVIADSDLIAAALRSGPTDAEIASCPGWDLTKLVSHVGGVYGWANRCMLDGAPPTDTKAFRPDPNADLATWFLGTAQTVAETLRQLDPDAPTWHLFPGEKINRVWPRRMAQETSIHRWDAQHAIGTPSPIDPTLASDGIDEDLDLVIGRLAERDDIKFPRQSLHIHCTDVDGEWLVWSDDDGYHLVRAHQKGDAALRGTAQAILLTLWGRDADASDLSPVGDEQVLADWLAISGM